MKPNVHIWVQACLYPESTPFGVWGYRISIENQNSKENIVNKKVALTKPHTNLTYLYLTAIIEALQSVVKSSHVTIYTDNESLWSDLEIHFKELQLYQTGKLSQIDLPNYALWEQLKQTVCQHKLLLSCRLVQNIDKQYPTPKLKTIIRNSYQNTCNQFTKADIWIHTCTDTKRYIVLLYANQQLQHFWGQYQNLSSTALELQALIDTLNTVSGANDIVIHTSSQYLYDGIRVWVPTFLTQQKGPITQAKQSYKQLWQKLCSLIKDKKLSTNLISQLKTDTVVLYLKQLLSQQHQLPRVKIHVDAICPVPHQLGGYGTYIGLPNQESIIFYGAVPTKTTLVQQYLLGLIKALTSLPKKKQDIHLYLSSQETCQGVEQLLGVIKKQVAIQDIQLPEPTLPQWVSLLGKLKEHNVTCQFTNHQSEHIDLDQALQLAKIGSDFLQRGKK